MKKTMSKFRLISFVIIIAASLGIAMTYAWLQKDLDSEPQQSKMGTVEVAEGVIDSIENGFYNVTFKNNSDIPVAVRIRVVPEKNDLSNSTITVEAVSDGWKAVKDNSGWYLVYGDSTNYTEVPVTTNEIKVDFKVSSSNKKEFVYVNYWVEAIQYTDKAMEFAEWK